MEPVKTILSTFGWVVSASPSALSPVTTLSTPGGRASATTLSMASELKGVWGEGLATTVLPARMAGRMCQVAIINGQFQGRMLATTPMGRRCTSMRPASSSCITSTGRSSAAVAAAQPWQASSSKREPGPESGLPCSRVSRRAKGSACSPSAAAMDRQASLRTVSGAVLQSGKARRAAATARSSSSAPAKGTCPTLWPLAGLRIAAWCDPPTRAPSITNSPTISCVSSSIPLPILSKSVR